MALRTLLLGALSQALLSFGQPEVMEIYNPSDLLCTCNQIAATISDVSQVFFPCERVVFLICDTPI
jgi:hypothetical protein